MTVLGMEVSLEPTEGDEDLPEPDDDILEDDNNNDGEEAVDEQAEEELLGTISGSLL